MSELEDSINQVLNDPKQMERIADIAKSLMGGGNADNAPDFDPKMLQRLSGIMNSGEINDSKDKKLLDAIRPYLSEKRRGKMDRALKLAKMARLASLAATEFGGDGDV